MRSSLSLTVLVTLAGCASVVDGPAEVPSSGAVRCRATLGHHDGDTFKCISELGDTLKVRVAGIDAPETGQAYWRVARARLRELAAPGSWVDCYKHDRYARSVCRLTSSDGRDAVEVLLAEGLG